MATYKKRGYKKSIAPASEKKVEVESTTAEVFEKLDSQVNYPDDAILFIGSSSIRLWKTLDKDMEPYNVIQRGYGGANFRDVIYFTERILADHKLKMVVCFIANDISGSSDDGSPREVL